MIIQAFQVFDQLIIQVIQVIQVIRRSVAVSDRWSRHVVVDGNWRRLRGKKCKNMEKKLVKV